jgi:hypothetical protein
VARILFMARGARTDDTFAVAAKELLARGHDVRVLHGLYMPHLKAIVSANWTGFPADRIIDFPKFVDDTIAKRPSTLEEVGSIEAELGLTQWAAASNYLIYRRFCLDQNIGWQPYYESEDEVRNEFVATHRVWRNELAAWRPDIAFTETFDAISTLVLLAHMRRQGVFFLGLLYPPLLGDGKILFIHGTYRRAILFEHFHKNPHRIPPEKLAEADQLLARLQQGEMARFEYIELHGERSQPRSLAQWMPRLRKIASRQVLTNPRGTIRDLRNRLWLERRFITRIPEGPYLLYFMQRQPEASTASAAPFWVDQERILEQLAVHAPAGLTIAVKENPRSFLLRGERYWQHIARLHNVVLLHPSLPGDKLIRGAAAALTINGSIGMEAAVLGKRVGLLGRPYYDLYPGFRRLDRPQDIFRHLADPDWRPELLVEERRRWIAAFLAAIVPFGAPARRGTIWPKPEEGGVNLADGLERHLELIRSHNLSVDDVEPGDHWRVPPSLARAG